MLIKRKRAEQSLNEYKKQSDELIEFYGWEREKVHNIIVDGSSWWR